MFRSRLCLHGWKLFPLRFSRSNIYCGCGQDERYRHPVWGRLRYVFTFYAMVDLVAVLPFYLPLVTKVDLRVIRALRLLRLARLLKLGRYSKSAQRFATVFRKQREQLILSLMVLLLLLVLSSTLVFFFEQEAQPEVFSSIPASLWWGIVTLTTIGYGDVYPITIGGKLCAAVISVLSVGLVALPSGIIVAGFVEEIEVRDENEKPDAGQYCPHCGKKLGGN